MRALRWIAGVAAAVLIASAGWACGDKLSVLGGGVRYDRIKQIRVSGRILLYAPEASQLRAANEELGLATALERAGLDVHVIELPDELQRQLALAEADLVLTDLSFFGSIDGKRGNAAILPVSFADSGVATSDGQTTSRCVAHITKRTGRQFVRVVEAILEKRSRGIAFDCGTPSQSDPV